MFRWYYYFIEYLYLIKILIYIELNYRIYNDIIIKILKIKINIENIYYRSNIFEKKKKKKMKEMPDL